MTWRMINKFEK